MTARPATSAASRPRSCIPIATRRSSTARCTSRCTCRSRTATATRATSPPCSRARQPATRTAARAIRRRRRSKRRSTRWKAASPPCASPPAWRRSARSLLCAAARRATTSSPATSCSATRTACSRRSTTHGTPVTFVDATDADNVEARAHARDAARVRRDDRQSAHAGRRPRAHRRALRARGILLRRRQHDDVAVAVPAEGRRRRRSSSTRSPSTSAATATRSAAAVTDTGLFDWTRFPNIADSYKIAEAGAVGHARRCARRACATSAARWPPSRRITSRSARRRWRCGWTRQCANAQALARLPRGASAACAPSTTRACRRIRSTRSRGELFRGFGALLSFELADGVDCFEFLNRLRVVVLSSNLGDNRTLAIPVAHTIFWEMGAGAARRDGHRRFADPRLGRHRGSRRPDRRFRAGARLNDAAESMPSDDWHSVSSRRRSHRDGRQACARRGSNDRVAIAARRATPRRDARRARDDPPVAARSRSESSRPSA